MNLFTILVCNSYKMWSIFQISWIYVKRYGLSGNSTVRDVSYRILIQSFLWVDFRKVCIKRSILNLKNNASLFEYSLRSVNFELLLKVAEPSVILSWTTVQIHLPFTKLKCFQCYRFCFAINVPAYKPEVNKLIAEWTVLVPEVMDLQL